MLEKLRTKEVLYKAGIVGDQTCLLCQHSQETVHHLFFECSYSKESLQGIKRWLGWRSSATRLEKIAKWIIKTKMGAFKRKIFCSVISALIYHLWRTRNEVFWDKKIVLPILIVQKVKQVVKLRLSLVKPKKASDQEKEWIASICAK